MLLKRGKCLTLSIEQGRLWLFCQMQNFAFCLGISITGSTGLCGGGSLQSRGSGHRLPGLPSHATCTCKDQAWVCCSWVGVSETHNAAALSPSSKSLPSGMMAWCQVVTHVTGSQKIVLGTRSWRLQGKLELGKGGTGSTGSW